MSVAITVDHRDAETRLDIYLSHHMSEVSRTRIQRALKDGRVEVNGGLSKKNYLLRGGDTIEIHDESLLEPPKEVEVVPQDLPLDIIYEDDHLLVLNKPAGLVVHPGNGNPDGTLLNGIYYYLRDIPGTPLLVHRLDKNTSGIIIAAKNEQAHGKMSTLFMQRKVYKGYLGFAIGRYPEKNGRINAPLGRSKSSPIKRTVRADGRPSVTDYLLLRYRCGISALAYRIHTGRTHQIRVHSAYSGFPLVMDNLYLGDKRKVKLLEPMERPFAYRIYAKFKRHALHSRYIAFDSPFTGQRTSFTAPLPADFRKACEAIDLSDEDLAVFETENMDSINY
ncbi:MAG: RluA family pseudouridine synthase [Fibrobacterota bacterium]